MSTIQDFRVNSNKTSFPLLQGVIQGMTDLIAVLDKDFRYIAFNHGYQNEFKKLYGTSIEIGSSLFDVLGHLPKEQAKAVELWGRALRGEEFTTVAMFGDDTLGPSWYEISYNPIRNEYNQVLGACHIVRDITDSKRAEEAMRISELRYKSVFQSTVQFMALLSGEGNILEINGTALDFAGASREEVIGRPFWECTCWGLTDQSQDELKLAIALARQGELARYEGVLKGANQAEAVVDFSIKPLTSENGRVILLIAEGRDVTELKRMQQEMLESNAQLEQLFCDTFEYSAVGLAHVGENGQLIRANKRLCTLLGYSHSELTGLALKDVTYPEDIGKDMTLFHELLAREIPHYTLEQRLVRKDESIIPVNLTVSPVWDSQGEYQYSIVTVQEITESKTGEHSQSENEHRYEMILEAAKVGLWDWRLTEEGQDNWWNEQLISMLGIHVPESERSFETILQFVPPEDQSEVLSALHAHLEKNEPFEVEFRFIRPSGDVLHLVCRGEALRDEFGNAIRMSGTLRDITEQKIAELGLKASEAKLRRLVETNFMGVLFISPSGKLADANDAFLKMIGYSREELESGKLDLSQLIPPYYQEQDRKKWHALFTRGECGPFEQQYIHKDGYPVDVLVGAAMVFGSDPMAICYVLDITEKKQVERQIRQSEQRLMAALSASQTGTYCWNSHCNELIWDDNLYKLFGITPDRSVRRLEDFLKLVHPEDRDRVQQVYHQQPEQKHDFELEFRVIWPDGSVHWLYDKGSAFIQEDNIPYVTGACVDTTSRKQWEIELEKAKRSAELANQKKSQFLANMSHELRTPLNAVLGYTQMLEKGIAGELSGKQLKYVHSIQVSGKHLLDMVNDILDISKIEAGRLKLSFERVDMDMLFTELTEMLTPMAYKRQVTLRFSKSPELKLIIADPARLKQVFCNLISNAIKFNKDGGSVDVRMSLSDDGHWYLGEVEDTGIGIPQDKIGDLFQEFYQVESEQSLPFEGTGLGLALTKHLVQFHGGQIEVESTLDKGSIFRFKLPVSPILEFQEKPLVTLCHR